MKKNNKGFTLVELIVVLVILAILAAILVPTLLGYIDRAKSEKDFSTAQTVRVAAQSEIDQLYGDSTSASIKTFYGVLDSSDTSDANKVYIEKVYDLAGVDKSVVKSFKFAYEKGIITQGYVQINSVYYQLGTNGQWTSVATAPTIPTPTVPATP